MMNATLSYWVRIGSGVELRCEALGLAPVSLERACFQPDVLTFDQYRVRGAWAVTLAHDESVRFYREESGGTLTQVFAGKVVSPGNAHDANSRRRLIRVSNVLQFAKEVIFHRGRWTPDYFINGVPTIAANYATNQNGDTVTLFAGDVLTKTVYPSSTHTQELRRKQTVTQAFSEAFHKLGLLVTRSGFDAVWQFTAASNFFGAGAMELSWTLEEPTTYLDWLIKCSQPLADAYLSWDYAGLRPVARAGRFRDVAATAVAATGWPVAAAAVERRLHEEVAGIVLAGVSSEIPGQDANYAPFPIAETRRPLAVYPASPVPNTIDRRVRGFYFPDDLTGSNWVTTQQAVPLAAWMGPSITGPVVSASYEACGAGDWLVPGAVLSVDGLRLNVQQTRWDAGTDRVQAGIGLPRQLGVDDMQAQLKWLSRWMRRR